MRTVASVAVLGAAVLLAGGAASGSTDAFRRAIVARGLESPVLVTHAPGEPKALYVVEQPGRILRTFGGHRRVFLDIRDDVDYGGERGLLGLAFSPDYARDHRFYVAYTTENENIVARYVARAGKAVPTSRTILLSVEDPYSNHNGGNLVFGPDRKLYTSIGDGGSGGDPGNRAQNPSSQFGKLLRLDGSAGAPSWSIVGLGLRNPWRFTFDRATGDLYLGDVGQGEIEEIDVTPRRSPGLENYGWNLFEGRSRYGDNPEGPGKLVFPVYEYHHTGGNCTVVGGYVYRGRARPAERGRYVFGDYCSGLVWSLAVKDGKARAVRREPFRIPGLTSFGEDTAGELYAVNADGVLFRLT
jgi:glucose/arabinose dehydrogenase